MKATLYIILFLLTVCAWDKTSAQETLADSITFKGVVVDDKFNEPIINAVVTLSRKGETISGAVTDYNGNFLLSIKGNTVDTYNLRAEYIGYKAHKVICIVPTEKVVNLDTIVLRPTIIFSEMQVCIMRICTPMFDVYEGGISNDFFI